MATAKKLPPPAKPAKRGDLVLVPHYESSTMMHGPTTRRKVWMLAIVTSITRDGRVKAAERPYDCTWPWKMGMPGECFVISRATVNADPETIIRGVPSEFETPAAAREALQPYKAAA